MLLIFSKNSKHLLNIHASVLWIKGAELSCIDPTYDFINDILYICNKYESIDIVIQEFNSSVSQCLTVLYRKIKKIDNVCRIKTEIPINNISYEELYTPPSSYRE